MKNGKRFLIYIWIFAGMSMIMPFLSNAQVFLQLERKYEVKSKRFGFGDQLIFQATALPKEWQKKRIDYLIPSEKLIMFTDGMVSLEEITKVQVINIPARSAGYMMTTFGAGWLLFGSVAQVAGLYKITGRDAVIGCLSVGVGTLFTYQISKRTYHMGSISRLRIIDIGFPGPVH